jgi:hypothetical protein
MLYGSEPSAIQKRCKITRCVYQNTDDLGKSRACTMLKAWDVHGNRLWLGKGFLLTFS